MSRAANQSTKYQAFLESYQRHSSAQTTSSHRQPRPHQANLTTSLPGRNHPYESTQYYAECPPIPELNWVINNYTLEIVQDLTGQP